MMNVRFAMLLTGMMLVSVVVPANAMPLPAPTMAKAPSASVVQVRGHGHRHGHHRDDHRFHGRDDYYERDDQSGVLFKSFITGTLFR